MTFRAVSQLFFLLIVAKFFMYMYKREKLSPWGLQHQLSVAQELMYSDTQTLDLFHFWLFHRPGQKSKEM